MNSLASRFTVPIAVVLLLTGLDHLMIRLDVMPQPSRLADLASSDARRLDASVGPVAWTAHPNLGWPQEAVWTDGGTGYHLTVLDAEPDAWSEADLHALVEVFAAAARAAS